MTDGGGRTREVPGFFRTLELFGVLEFVGACGVLRNSLLFGVGTSRDTKSLPTAAHSRVPTHEQKHEATGVRDGTIAGGGRQSMSARQVTVALSRHSVLNGSSGSAILRNLSIEFQDGVGGRVFGRTHQPGTAEDVSSL